MRQPRAAELGAKLRKLSVIMGRQAWRRALLGGVAATVEHMPLASLIKPRTVLDIGANKGQFSIFAAEMFPGCKIIAFEPLPEPARRFKAVTRSLANVRLIECAVGPEEARGEMHISKREDSSSLLPIDSRMAEVFPEAVDSGKRVEVRIAPLSQLINEDELEPPILLKLDVQGFELDALLGCAPLLSRIHYAYLECSYIKLYRGQVLKDEILAWLSARHFHFSQEINLLMDQNGNHVQSDCLFINKQLHSLQ